MYKDPKKRMAYGRRLLKDTDNQINGFAAAIAAICILSADKELKKEDKKNGANGNARRRRRVGRVL